MTKNILKIRIYLRNKSTRIILFLILFNLFLGLTKMSINLNFYNVSNNLSTDIGDKSNLKSSAFWASINITNYQLNNTRHYHNSTISIEGFLKNETTGIGVQFMEVAVFVNNVLYPQFNSTTDVVGVFQIDFRIPYSFDVYSVSGYKVQVNVTDPSKGKVKKQNFLIIFANATSYFDINYVESPNIPGETFSVDGYLRDDTGSSIPNAQINYQWYNDSNIWPINSFFTSPTDGSISQSISIPIDAFSEKLYLNLSYSGDSPYTNSTKKTLSIDLFWDINCEWNTIPNASEGDKVIIKGQLSSKINNTLKIYNRTIDIYYDGNYINSTNTDTNGNFSYAYTIPTGTGNKSIQIKLINSVGLSLSSFYFINITKIIIPPSDPTNTEPPYLGFFINILTNNNWDCCWVECIWILSL